MALVLEHFLAACPAGPVMSNGGQSTDLSLGAEVGLVLELGGCYVC